MQFGPARTPSTGPKTDLAIGGLDCQSCVRQVTEALQRLPGVAGVLVSLETERATVRWKADAVPAPEALVSAIKNAGYEATVIVPATPTTASSATTSRRTEFAIDGMDCPNCVRHAVEALQSVPGVEAASVTLETGRGTVTWKTAAPPDTAAALAALKNAGYPARVLETLGASGATGGDEPTAHASGWQFTVTVGLLGTLPLMLGEWVFHLMDVPWFRWMAFALAGVVQVLAGARFYRGAWRQFSAGHSNMDTLVSLGSTTAFLYSVWVLFSGNGGHLYFMEAAAIITLISLGHWMEARVSARATNSLRALMQLAPRKARRFAAGRETEVPVAELQRDDLVVLRPGDRIPTDGEVTSGDSAVDESMLTGESAPVDKKPGAPLYAGTANLNGRLLMRVTATGEATALAHIIEAVQRAQHSRANIQRLGDRVSNVFVPIVIVIALLTALWWGLFPEQAHAVASFLARFLWNPHLPASPLEAAIIGAASVLIIACPCAMGLATPAAIMAASNAAAQRGFLIRDGVALEKAGEVTAVLFDKTGTITVGKPSVVEMKSLPGAPENALALAAALARNSAHPLSQTIARLSATSLELASWQEIRGSGVQGAMPVASGTSSQETLRLGSLTWLQENGVINIAGDTFVSEWMSKGATILGLAAGPRLLHLFALQDTLKPHVGAVLEELRRSGLRVFLVTGDNRATALSLAAQAGIDVENVFAEVRPEAKAGLVKQLQSAGERVAFVGDGINDAPALEQADLGIAVSRASDVAREAADIILLNSDIEAVSGSLDLARATLRTIKQNLFWAFFYNAVGIPLAALGFMSPVLCAAAMGLSDIVVIGNALRLLRRGR